ncbi:hypothetical protein SUGI_1110120 [Cryptomeria japonica]|uniref:F-box protein At5g46170 n=1 Tax=Cryptomeria japonica TaxID=3369 RepID=UPI002414A513|nr:F-box protein At5g46170 [Cryptomeria japonica]GLJ52186.1 hypothetical protein SUGI_1110120 [Cryptomeria japonica]
MHLELGPDRCRHQQRGVRKGTASASSSYSSSSHVSSTDHLDRLPDSLLLVIFNKIADVKALGRCCAVSRRFHSLVPQAENVVVKVDCVISGEESNLSGRGRGLFSHIVRLMIGSIVKPLQALQHLIGPRKAMLGQVSPRSPGEILKNFKEIQHLRIELPAGELGLEEGVLLKWKAEFGSSLESCVILGATSKGLRKYSSPNPNHSPDSSAAASDDESEERDDNGSIPESFYTNGGLKLRVVWTISSLIAASARHFLLQQIICDHPTLHSLILTDADGQGTLCLGREQLKNFRLKPLAASASSNRTQIPALNMKLRYARNLALPGVEMNGATLVTIRPTGDSTSTSKESEGFIATAFDEEAEAPYRAAVGALLKRRTYLLEMNSF